MGNEAWTTIAPATLGVTGYVGTTIGGPGSNIWVFAPLPNTIYRLVEQGVFACSLYSAAGEMPDSTLVSIWKTDMDLENGKQLLSEHYKVLKAFSDITLQRAQHLNIPQGLSEVLTPGNRLVIQVNGYDATGAGFCSNVLSNFKLGCWRTKNS